MTYGIGAGSGAIAGAGSESTGPMCETKQRHGSHRIT